MARWVATLVLMLATHTMIAADARDGQWKRVEEAMNKGLPKTALEELEPLIRAALADKAWAEATKAITRKIVLEAQIEGGRPEEKIPRLKAVIDKAPEEIVPVLNTILATWYWHYFQANRWRFMSRTATAQPPGNDFTTWDLARLFAEIDNQFGKALAAERALQAIPIASYDDLLLKGTLPDEYRPTLYDFVAHEALAFYTAGEQAGAKPQDAFEVSADSPILDTVDQFLVWQPVTTHTDSPAWKAIQLYQALLRFHQHDSDPSAFVDADLGRLNWARNVAVGERKHARFKEAMKRLADKWADHELASMALYHWASVVHEEFDFVQARALALRGQTAHPQSPGGKLCANLVALIEAKTASIATERVWNAPWPQIVLRYRNVSNIWFRAVAWDWDGLMRRRGRGPDHLDEAERRAVLAAAPALEWSHALPPTVDYKERRALLPAPDALKPGYYLLLASHRPDFSETDNEVAMTPLWVSDLALITRPRAGQLEGFVLQARTGEPVREARVQAWHLNRRDAWEETAATTTDEHGFFVFNNAPAERGYLLKASKGAHAVATSDQLWWSPVHRPEPHEQTLFFTDRRLYRPGQIIQYKGICLRVDQQRDNYTVLSGREVTVVFRDPNGKEVARARHRCNDYGSFAGSFNAPRGGLLGRMLLQVEGEPGGQTWVNVEEYKRPKFQVTLDAPQTAPRLEDKVRVQGRALAYTGAAIDGAAVKWRVVREVRFPPWWAWFHARQPWRGGEHQEIAHGEGRTAADGSFHIEFVATPDRAVPEADEPTFTFTVHADVTDSAGETRSASRAVTVGYTALQITTHADDWQTAGQPVELKLSTRTLDGEPQAAEGTLKVHRLKEPERVQRPPLGGTARGGDITVFDDPDPTDPNQWDLGPAVIEQGFTTGADGTATNRFQLPVGLYRVIVESQDRFGRKVTARQPIRILDPAADKLALKVPSLLAAPAWSLEPGKEFVALWGTGYEEGRAFIEVEHRHRLVERFWTRPGRTQQQIRRVVTEAMRGGFTLHVTQVRENRAYLESRHVDVPWSNKELTVKWERFRSKLEPGRNETWTVAVQSRNPKAEDGDAERAVAEMVATLYDASLDQFLAHGWPSRFGVFRQDWSSARSEFANAWRWLQRFLGQWQHHHETVELRYRAFPPDITANLWGPSVRFDLAVPASRVARSGELRFSAVASATALSQEAGMDRLGALKEMEDLAVAMPGLGGGAGPRIPDLSRVTARKNLNETAFFFPQLTSDANGVVRITFTMPEALTEWRFLGFAHDRTLRSGLLEDRSVTAKDLMVQPNPPRFLREGDTLEFTVKVSNQSDTRQIGQVRLTFDDALDGGSGVPPDPDHRWSSRKKPSADALLGNHTPEQAFDIPPKESRSFSWRLTVPDGGGFLTYKAVAATDTVSDGEEGYLPVLSRRVLVTESLPLPIRGPATKKFSFTRLQQAGRSKTLQHQSLTVQMVSQPVWYAVMALPYLMEFPHECTEQTFNRFYANALARFIANSDPKIRRLFDQWKASPALDSPLEKNAELKSVALEETPWLRQAQNESRARKNVGVLFDANRLDYELQQTLQKLADAQLEDGAWPWFPGGRGNDFITLYIVTGFGRLRHLGVSIDATPAVRALNRLDGWLEGHYRQIVQHGRKEDNHLSPTIALYLYGRSFFLKDRPIAPQHREAVDFFLTQARRFWLQLGERQSQGHLALALKRFNSFNSFTDATPTDITRSLKERAVASEELGLFWRDTEHSWWWYRAPIETQAVMIEAFDEVAGDAQAVEECRVWLLKQKQTQDWKTTKATADAVYALLLRGRNWLASDQLVEVTLGGLKLTPGQAPISKPKAHSSNAPEPGTGFYERRIPGSEIKPALAQITVKKHDPGVAWGSVHWQYLEDLSRVKPYAGTPLTLKKALFTRRHTRRGPELVPVTGPLAVGDELVVRLELRADRDLEYVHLKDQRGSGTEPVNVLSGYRYQDGLAYYETTRDTASHFFIDYLPKGTYVFEYSTRIQHRGEYQSGVAEIQCMYAPEFNSHSESLRIQVR